MGYEMFLKDQLDVEILKQEYPHDREMIDGYVGRHVEKIPNSRGLWFSSQ